MRQTPVRLSTGTHQSGLSSPLPIFSLSRLPDSISRPPLEPPENLACRCVVDPTSLRLYSRVSPVTLPSPIFCGRSGLLIDGRDFRGDMLLRHNIAAA
jgi:hypothetical protein